MNKQKIVFDFDNVIVNSSKAFLDCVYYLYNKKENFIFPQWDKVRKWDFSCVAPYIDKNRIEEIFESKMFFENLSYYYENYGYSTGMLLQQFLDSDDYNVTICTKGTDRNLELKKEWILSRFNISEDKIILMSGMNMDKSEIDMSDAIQIDDHQDNLYSTNANDKIIFSFNGNITEYNADAIMDDNIYNVFSLEDLITTIMKIRNKNM